MPSSPLWRPYTQEGTAPAPLRLRSAAGAYLFAEDGRRLFDGNSSWWVITHGHCEPSIVEAVQRQAAVLDQALFANFTHASAEELAARLVAAAPPGLDKVFLSENGSTAVEVALKMAAQFHQHRGETARTKFLAFEHAYHGDTVGAMSVSARGPFTAAFRKMTFEVIRARQPRLSTAPRAEWISDFQSLLGRHQKELAAVILEPVLQGAAGMVVWPREAVREIARLCREAHVPLIFDEVLTGFGRTGPLFASLGLGVSPDFLCLSKGLTGGTLPLGATLTTAEVFEAFRSREASRMFFHGHSFTGNPLACAAAAANLRLAVAPEFGARCESVSAMQRRQLARLAKLFPLEDPRLCGTIAAFELPSAEAGYLSGASKHLTAFCLERGLFVRPLGNTIYLMPPYSASEADLTEAWAGLEAFLRQQN